MPENVNGTLHRRWWLKHTATVPKGFLRYQVLELLSGKAMSGSEIMKEIERRTNGFWRPSPGSIYPLLAWLQSNGYIDEVPSEQPGVKRYALTDRGRRLLEEQRKALADIHFGKRLFALSLISELWLHMPEEAKAVREALRRFFRALVRLGLALEERFERKALEEALAIIDEAAERLEVIERRVRGECC